MLYQIGRSATGALFACYGVVAGACIADVTTCVTRYCKGPYSRQSFWDAPRAAADVAGGILGAKLGWKGGTLLVERIARAVKF